MAIPERRNARGLTTGPAGGAVLGGFYSLTGLSLVLVIRGGCG